MGDEDVDPRHYDEGADKSLENEQEEECPSSGWFSEDDRPQTKKRARPQPKGLNLQCLVCEGILYKSIEGLPFKLQLRAHYAGDAGVYSLFCKNSWAEGKAVDIPSFVQALKSRFVEYDFQCTHRLVALTRVKDEGTFQSAIYSGKLINPPSFSVLDESKQASIGRLVRPPQGADFGAAFFAVVSVVQGSPPAPSKAAAKEKSPAWRASVGRRSAAAGEGGGSGGEEEDGDEGLDDEALFELVSIYSWARAAVYTSDGEVQVETLSHSDVIDVLRRSGAIIMDKKTGEPAVETRALRSLKSMSDATFLGNCQYGAELLVSAINNSRTWRETYKYPPMTLRGASEWLGKAVARGNGSRSRKKGGVDGAGGSGDEAVHVTVPITFDMEQRTWRVILDDLSDDLAWYSCAWMDELEHGGNGFFEKELLPMLRTAAAGDVGVGIGGGGGGGGDGGVGGGGAAMLADALAAVRQPHGLAPTPVGASNRGPERLSVREVERELRELRQLCNEGVISEEENRAGRERILIHL